LQSTTPLSDFPCFVADCVHLVYLDKYSSWDAIAGTRPRAFSL
jgi:hypothetical protein